MLTKNVALMVLVMFAAGCGLEAKTYVMTRPRVGLDQGSGNGGCVVGKCPPAPAPAETTRKVYVLEITKPVPESEVRKIEENAVNAIVEPPAATTTESTTAAAPGAAAPSTVSVTEAPDQAAVPAQTASAPASGEQGAAVTSYTVQKDDTLQKISKKVYGTYSRWYKIYQANKEKIKNPNVLKPGTVLTIPSLK